MRVQAITGAEFGQHREAFYALLSDAVKHGASVGFLANFSAAEAQSYFDHVQVGLDHGTHLLWMAFAQQRLLGTVQLVLCHKANGLNRGEIQKLLVHSEARRQGVASQLIQQLERCAQQLKRGLLYLDTEAGSSAEAFYRSHHYQSIGGLPDYACGPDGQYRANAIYYKTLSRPQP